MAKYLYHIPTKQIRGFLSKHKDLFVKALNHKDMFIYYKNFGKSFYALQVGEFLRFYKIDADYAFANRSYLHLFEERFLKNFYDLLNLREYCSLYGNQKEIFFIFIYILQTKDKTLADSFIQKVFIHFYTLIKRAPKKDFIQIAQGICKARKLTLKESYTDKTDGKITFSLFVNSEEKVRLEGNSIKTLRKKAYKRLVFEILDS